MNLSELGCSPFKMPQWATESTSYSIYESRKNWPSSFGLDNCAKIPRFQFLKKLYYTRTELCLSNFSERATHSWRNKIKKKIVQHFRCLSSQILCCICDILCRKYFHENLRRKTSPLIFSQRMCFLYGKKKKHKIVEKSAYNYNCVYVENKILLCWIVLGMCCIVLLKFHFYSIRFPRYDTKLFCTNTFVWISWESLD